MVDASTGKPMLELIAEGMLSITGVTSRDGTVIIAGVDTAGDLAFTAYNVQNEEVIDPNPANGPATLTATLPRGGDIDWPDAIRQPSGLAWEPVSQSWVVTTDQGEFFSLSQDFADVLYTIDRVILRTFM